MLFEYTSSHCACSPAISRVPTTHRCFVRSIWSYAHTHYTLIRSRGTSYRDRFVRPKHSTPHAAYSDLPLLSVYPVLSPVDAPHSIFVCMSCSSSPAIGYSVSSLGRQSSSSIFAQSSMPTLFRPSRTCIHRAVAQ